jgi:hypothetical protein
VKILIINTTKRRYGRKVYEKMVGEDLSTSFEVEAINISLKSRGKF